MRSALPMVVLPTLPTFAGPQDDPQPPVDVVAGDGRFLSDATVSLTLTLDGAIMQGDLEPGQVEQARAAAAAAQGQAQAGAGADESTGERPDGSASRLLTANSDAAVVGECWFRAATVPAGDSRWGGNDPAAGTLLVNPCNGPEQYLFVPNPAPGDPGRGRAATTTAAGSSGVGAAGVRGVDGAEPGGETVTARGQLGSAVRRPALHLGRPLDLDLERGMAAAAPERSSCAGCPRRSPATPTALVFDPGDGSAPVTCDGPGRPWTEADGSDPPSAGACGYMYRAVTPNGPLTATTSIQWSVAWTSNVGAGGTFPGADHPIVVVLSGGTDSGGDHDEDPNRDGEWC